MYRLVNFTDAGNYVHTYCLNFVYVFCPKGSREPQSCKKYLNVYLARGATASPDIVPSPSFSHKLLMNLTKFIAYNHHRWYSPQESENAISRSNSVKFVDRTSSARRRVAQQISDRYKSTRVWLRNANKEENIRPSTVVASTGSLRAMRTIKRRLLPAVSIGRLKNRYRFLKCFVVNSPTSSRCFFKEDSNMLRLFVVQNLSFDIFTV